MKVVTKAIDQSLPFLLYANCIPVKGATRSTICDVGRNTYYFIPNDLYDIINVYEGKSIEHLKKKYSKEVHNIIDDYFNFLVRLELVFFTDSVKSFPKIEVSEWKSPFEILQFIIDIDQNSTYLNSNLLKEVIKFSPKHIQFRYYNSPALDELTNYIKLFDTSCIEGIEIILPYDEKYSYEDYNLIAKSNLRVNSIIITSAPYDKYKGVFSKNSTANIIYVKNKITQHSYCGVINHRNFAVNLETFSESFNYNTCLNKKMSIDVNGNIRNCPSMQESFGHVENTKFEEALNNTNFKAYWGITKEQIDICKDCEFKRICTDCRAYTEKPDNKFSKPLKCGYDPYTNVWENWSENILKQAVMENYILSSLKK